MSHLVTETQIRAAVAIFTAFEMSQHTPEQAAALGTAVVEAMPDLFANGDQAAVGAFCALMRSLLDFAALSRDPAERSAVWQQVVDKVTNADL